MPNLLTCNTWGNLLNHPLQTPNSRNLSHLMKFCIISAERPMTSVKHPLLCIGIPHDDLTPNIRYRFKSTLRSLTKCTGHFIKVLRTK